MKQTKGLALWVPAESKSRFFSSVKALQPLKDRILKFHFTDIFIQVFRQGRVFFESSFFESAARTEVLADLLQFLSEHNIKAHAWINVCNLGTSPSEKYLGFLGGEKAFLKNNFSMIPEGFQIDTPGHWIEPSNPKLPEALRFIINEISAFDFDGLHLDFIRFPYAIPIRPASWVNTGVDYGYSEQALERFLSGRPEDDFFCGDSHQLVSEEKSLEFDSWRRLQITNLLKICRKEIKDRELSAAVLAWSDRAYLNAYQDWRSWMTDNIVDSLALMTYTADSNLLIQQCRQAAAFLTQKQKLFAGVGLYKLNRVGQLQDQIELIELNGFKPSIFCAEALLDDKWGSLAKS